MRRAAPRPVSSSRLPSSPRPAKPPSAVPRPHRAAMRCPRAGPCARPGLADRREALRVADAPPREHAVQQAGGEGFRRFGAAEAGGGAVRHDGRVGEVDAEAEHQPGQPAVRGERALGQDAARTSRRGAAGRSASGGENAPGSGSTAPGGLGERDAAEQAPLRRLPRGVARAEQQRQGEVAGQRRSSAGRPAPARRSGAAPAPRGRRARRRRARARSGGWTCWRARGGPRAASPPPRPPPSAQQRRRRRAGRAQHRRRARG